MHPPSEDSDLITYTAIEARLAGLSELVSSQRDKIDAVHLSIEKDIAELKGAIHGQGNRIGKAELRLAQLQGAGAALTLGLPFIAVALDHLLK